MIRSNRTGRGAVLVRGPLTGFRCASVRRCARARHRHHQHPEIPDACYPLPMALPARLGLSWSAFRVSGAPELTPVEDIELELERRRARDEQVRLMEANLRRECQQFVEQYVLGFRHEVAAFCDQVVAQKGQVHGKTLRRHSHRRHRPIKSVGTAKRLE